MIVELKNDMQLRGILHSVDQYLNVKLENLTVDEQEKHPHLVSADNQTATAEQTATAAKPARMQGAETVTSKERVDACD